MIPALARPAGFQMIRSVDVRNFRCFERLYISDCKRLNVIVGDNGAGKTALLESIFLALATTTEIARRYRGQRGIDGGFTTGTARRLEEAIFGGLFRNRDFSKPISITLDGDGPDNRSVSVSRGSVMELPFDSGAESGSGPFFFVWRDAAGNTHPLTPAVGREGPVFPDTGEDMQDFFHYPSNQNISSIESASRFSALSKARRQADFVSAFTEEYPWIEDIDIEVDAGHPLLHATIRSVLEKQPLPEVSSGINRIASIMVSLAFRRRSVGTVDEIENGVYYTHYTALWRALLRFLRNYEGQLFVTTHSLECIHGLLKAAGDDTKDIALWRLERGKEQQPELFVFSGDTLQAGIELGVEVRGGAE